ncbi:hypothetical protein L5I01_13230 [Gordonia sp. HY442]|uniref:hypothetical protein n=1 Tax=Gordonia zhenghanii TaxID=2911516 RepID=UPI001F27F3AC|nr:hypothetical protein [Gordonia zhenghanii]MCF8604316.1 hypothetical protein [Gordonia zhenghanii]
MTILSFFTVSAILCSVTFFCISCLAEPVRKPIVLLMFSDTFLGSRPNMVSVCSCAACTAESRADSSAFMLQ